MISRKNAHATQFKVPHLNIVQEKADPVAEKEAPTLKIVNEVDKPIDKYFPRKTFNFRKKRRLVRIPNTNGCMIVLSIVILMVLLSYLLFRILS
ncbi:MAG TPA: hypothetical protein VKN36_17420 [Eudoraea sp.]|nr:hypothetical protein [Eudoraea sp.]